MMVPIRDLKLTAREHPVMRSASLQGASIELLALARRMVDPTCPCCLTPTCDNPVRVGHDENQVGFNWWGQCSICATHIRRHLRKPPSWYWRESWSLETALTEAVEKSAHGLVIEQLRAANAEIDRLSRRQMLTGGIVHGELVSK